MSAWSIMCFQADGFQACHVNPLFSVLPLMGVSANTDYTLFCLGSHGVRYLYVLARHVLYVFF